MPKAKSSPKADPATLVELGMVLMMDVSINVDYTLDIKDVEKNLFLEAELTKPTETERSGERDGYSYFYVCKFRCGRRVKDTEDEVHLISAKYGAFLKSPTEMGDKVSDFAIRKSASSIWPRFLAVAAILSQQMYIKLPQLPNMIDHDHFSFAEELEDIS